MRAIAIVLNEAANSISDKGHTRISSVLYSLASFASPSWSVPHFNLGLHNKHALDWKKCLAQNQRAVLLNAGDEGAWWNLGIAATALHEWNEAERAWKKCGLKIVEIRDDEVYAPCGTGCVRINPQGEHTEVVWGKRLDPARTRIANIPLPRSNRRFKDIILNDGSEEGTRMRDGEEFPVFDELAVWEASSYSTYSAALRLGDNQALHALESVCESLDVAWENWGTIRLLCEACSRGNPGEHLCAANTEATGDQNFGFASTSREVLLSALDQWKASAPASDYSIPRLEFLAKPTGVSADRLTQ